MNVTWAQAVSISREILRQADEQRRLMMELESPEEVLALRKDQEDNALLDYAADLIARQRDMTPEEAELLRRAFWEEPDE